MHSPRTLEQLRQRYGPRYRWLLLGTVMVGTMASIMASTIVNVAIPDLSSHFALGQAQAQWVASGFMVAVTLSMLLTPWLLQRFGLRRTYSVTLAALSLGALAGGLSSEYWQVLAMRIVEGLAAGVLQPIPSVIILRGFDDSERGRAMGVYGFGVVLAPAIGPSVGGVLVDAFGWRSIFFVMLPFGVLGLALAHRYMPLAASVAERVPIDWKGLLLITVVTLALLNGLARLQADHLLDGALLIALAAGALAGFLWLERRLAAPLMNLALFRSPAFASGAAVATIYGIALFGSSYLVPVFLQAGLHYGAAEAGLVLLPAGLVLAVAMAITGRMADRYPAHLMTFAGLVVLAVSFALMATVHPDTAYVLLLAWVIVGRIGLSLVLPALSLGAMQGLPRTPGVIAQGSSTISYMRQLGGAVGVSIAGIALEWRLAVHGTTLDAVGSPAGKIRAFDETFIGVAVLCAVAAAVALRMKKRPG